jgi:alanine racemase
MAVIKGNAYGHGLLPVAKTLVQADCLGVARLTEASLLRHAGIDTPIALLGGVASSTDLELVPDLDLQLGVHNEEQIGWLENFRGQNVDVWLKIDTGMNRLGFRPDQVAAAIDRIQKCPALGELRLLTHFANADDRDDPMTRRQLAAFTAALGDFEGDISIANSAGILGWPEIGDALRIAQEDGRVWIRPGLALYGISPFSEDFGSTYGLDVGLQFESSLIALKKIVAGDKVGYGGTWQASQDTVIGLVAAGYGDGYCRHVRSGAPVAINGRRVPVVGRISMDICAIDLGADVVDQVGDTVVLWGDAVPVEEVARFADTIPYTLVTGITDRVERIYEQ